MNEYLPAGISGLLTRRGFIGVVAVAGVALAAAPYTAMLAEATAMRPHAIVSFHMDRPYIDRSGMAMPYYPPLGARSGQFAARLSEEEFRRSCIYA